MRSLKKRENVKRNHHLFGQKLLSSTSGLRQRLLWSLVAIVFLVIVTTTFQVSDIKRYTYSVIIEMGRSVSDATGLLVVDVLVNGRKKTKKSSLLNASNIKFGEPILGVDIKAMQGRISNLPWVETVKIERQLPNRIIINLNERKPIGRWQRDGQLRLIDQNGVVISILTHNMFQNLPIIIGKGAPKKAKSILLTLKQEPLLFDRVNALTFVTGRRWDVRLDDKINIKLPEHGVEEAWASLATIEKGHKVLGKDVIAIDMRIPEKFIIKLTPAKAADIRKPGKTT
jgi:cell division protein FtsQ